MKNVYGYVRVSTIKQGEGVSLDEQRDSIETYARKFKLNVTEWFEEKETAAKQGRPLFTRMIKSLKEKKADGVVMHKIDRSARNLRDWAAVGELMDAGIEVHFSFESIDFSTRGGRLSADIQAVISADYIRNLRAETIKGFYGRLKQGIWPLPSPIGYLDMGPGIPKKVDPQRSDLIRKMFDLYATGNFSVRSLTTKMNELGLRNKSGRPITKITISTTLNNPYYYGVMKVKKTGETFLGKHRPLISKKKFDLVQNLLNSKTVRKKNRHEFAFRRTIRCFNCGYSLIGEIQKGHTYYRCQTKGCPTKTIRECLVAEQMRAFLNAALFKPELLAYIRAQFKKLRSARDVKNEKVVSALTVQVSRLEEREKILMDALLDGLVSKEEYVEKKSEISVSLVEARRKLTVIEKPDRQFWQSVDKFLELLETISLVDKDTEIEKLRDLALKISSNLLLDRKKLLLEPISVYVDALNLESVLLSCPCRDRPRTFAKDLKLFDLSKLEKKKVKSAQSDAIVKSISNYCIE